jgi:thiol:disulfide interchange protein DsbD
MSRVIPSSGLWSVLAGLALALGAATAGEQTPRGRHVKASLVSDVDAVRPDQPLTLGIRLEMEKGWHTYWRNPGDSGLPTRVKWALPEGFVVGEIRWPYPIRFETGPLVSYGYEHEVLLPVEVRVPALPGSGDVRIAARVDWLECQEICLPGRADVSLTLPVRPKASRGPEAPLFAEARRRVRSPRGADLREAYLYAVTPRLLDYAKPQRLTREGAAHRLELSRDPNGTPAESLAGVLVAGTESGTVAVEVDVKIASRPARASPRQERKP